MLTVHHLANSRSQRILWLLEELGTDYEVKRYERDPVTGLAPAELKAVHPLGKAPVITDNGRAISESGAIIEYIIEHYGDGRLQPAKGTPEAEQFRFWMHYAEGSFAPLMVMSLVFNRVENAKMPFFAKPIARSIVGKVKKSYLGPNIKRALDFMEDSLTQTKWFAGPDMTAADVQMSFAVEAAAVRTDLQGHYPKLQEFLTTIHARDTYQRALQRGGPYQLGR